jgi:hypothetical protein
VGAKKTKKGEKMNNFGKIFGRRFLPEKTILYSNALLWHYLISKCMLSTEERVGTQNYLRKVLPLKTYDQS